MNTEKKATVQIVGAPVACEEGIKDSWREVADWAADQLVKWFGEAVQLKYFDLFDPDCPPLPLTTELPVVMIDGEVISNGGKVSLSTIRKRLEDIGFLNRKN
jgi:hypothetical protein